VEIIMASSHLLEYPPVPYAFDMLPVHPPPCPDESLSGYLLRLVELNGIVRLGDLHVLLFPSDLTNKRFETGPLALVDYPWPRMETIQSATGSSASELLATTVFHVGQKFACETNPELKYFLAESLSAYRRFCPGRLAEGRWYRLSWRFLHLTGCPFHGCSLLDSCGHCGSMIPLFQSNLRIERCPTCAGDLATCDAPALTPTDLSSVRCAANDLSFLLGPSRNRQQNAGILEQVGQTPRQARRQRNEQQGDVVQLLELPYYRITRLEHRANAGHRITLQSFFAYVRYLGLSVRGVFETHGSSLI
jgi:TniQ